MRELIATKVIPHANFGCQQPLAYFSVIRQILAIITANPRAERLRDVVCAHFGGDPSPPQFTSKLRSFESLLVGERHRMMSIAAHLQSEWPDAFLALCKEAGMWPSWAMRGGPKTQIPLEYAEVVRALGAASRAQRHA